MNKTQGKQRVKENRHKHGKMNKQTQQVVNEDEEYMLGGRIFVHKQREKSHNSGGLRAMHREGTGEFNLHKKSIIRGSQVLVLGR